MVQNGYYGDHLARTFRTDAKPPSVTRTLARATFAVTHFCCLDPPNEVTDTHGAQSAYSLAVHRRPLENYRLWIEGKPQPHETRGVGAVTVFDLRQNKVALLRKPIDCMHYYIPRSALDYAAQQNGMPACGDLTTRFGANLTDPILNGISNTLFPATLHPEEVNELFFDYMILATLTHVATRYGEWSPTRTIAVGGLAPWQLRRAQQMIMGDLSGRLSLARIAAECNTRDIAANPDLQRWMYERSGAKVTTVEASHAVYISHPKIVARVIEEAARSSTAHAAKLN